MIVEFTIYDLRFTRRRMRGPCRVLRVRRERTGLRTNLPAIPTHGFRTSWVPYKIHRPAPRLRLVNRKSQIVNPRCLLVQPFAALCRLFFDECFAFGASSQTQSEPIKPICAFTSGDLIHANEPPGIFTGENGGGRMTRISPIFANSLIVPERPSGKKFPTTNEHQ
jgi:hypothetical protein